MSKKFFSLIHGETVHIAPKTKVIKADAFSKMVDADDVLKSVQEDAKRYRLEVSQECEKLKEQAQKEGFEEGFKKWAEHVAKLEEEIVKVRKDMEKVVVPIALKAAKKILGRELELSETAIVDIVSNSLKSVAQHKKITIYVNRKDLNALEANRPRLKEIFESLEALSLRERADIQSGGCVIETEGGIINAQLDNQWRVLENAFITLMKHKSNISETSS